MDFRGKHPISTFQYLLNKDANGNLYDGSGSLVQNLNLTTSYAIYQISYEISSSFASSSTSASFAPTNANVVTNLSTTVGALAIDSTGNASAVIAGALAIGQEAQAIGADSVAIGSLTSALSWDSTAIGAGAVSSHSSSVALGALAQTTTTNQIRLGINIQTASVPGAMEVLGRLFATASYATNVVNSVFTGSTAPVTLLGYFQLSISGSNYWIPFYSSP